MTASITPSSPSSLSCNALPIIALTSTSSSATPHATPGTSELTSLSPLAILPTTLTGTLPANALVVLVLHCSLSMLVADITPNTLTSACSNV